MNECQQQAYCSSGKLCRCGVQSVDNELLLLVESLNSVSFSWRNFFRRGNTNARRLTMGKFFN
jgi:hypothetical protein